VRRIPRHALQRLDDHLVDLGVGDRPRPARPRLIHQPVQPVLREPVAPPDLRESRLLSTLMAFAIHALAARGELPVDRLDVLPESASLTTLPASVDGLMPAADLPDLVLEIAAKTECLHEFTNDHEPNAQLRDLEISLCAVLVAQACNVGYRPLVDDGNPALRRSRMRYVAQRATCSAITSLPRWRRRRSRGVPVA
jgi:hypothetical protein